MKLVIDENTERNIHAIHALGKRFYFDDTDPRLKQLTDSKVSEWRNWFDTRLDDAIEAASAKKHPEIERKRKCRNTERNFILSFSVQLFIIVHLVRE